MQPYQIVFQNEHFIIVDKGPGILSVPGREGLADTRPVLGLLLERDLQVKIYPVHRLDFEVQGLIMYALTPVAHKAGNAWFEKKTIHKIYSALSISREGWKIGERFEWKCKLLRGKKRAYESPAGKDSITYAYLESVDSSGYFHWELSPVTGRSHQLRYELFRHEMPIVGDTLYGSKESWPHGIALRAFKLDFKNVINHKEFSLPDEIVVKKL